MSLIGVAGPATSVAHAGTGVVPASTSWPSADRGWVLGLDTLCQTANCPQLVRTLDGGATWTRVKTPALSVPGTDRLRVVFGNDAAGMVTDGEQLFVTSNGGTRWEPSGIKGTVGALGFDDSGFLAVVYDGTSSRLFHRELWFGPWQPVPGVEVKGQARGDIVPGQVSLSTTFVENRYWTRSAAGWLEEPAPCPVEAVTRLGTVGADRYALCGSDPGFGNMTKELRRSSGGEPFKTVGVPPREGITTGFAVSPEAALVAATGRDWSFVHRAPGEKWDTPLTLGGPPFEDLAFSDARHATLVRGGPGQEFAEIHRSDDAGLTWKLVSV
ncbi:YCF48-related protein [Lentzea sp. E54]|uniref:YCF48-related protein n=1 Tax=Lentzea xerophila TaxID=3435883 RepID=UPI003DA60A1A